MKTIDLSKETEDFYIKLPQNSKAVYDSSITLLEISVLEKDPFDLVPKSLEEFYEKNPELKEFWEESKKEIGYHLSCAYLSYNETDTEAILALIQLRRLWHEWVKVLGEPDKYKDSYSITDDSENGIWYSYSCQGIGMLRFKEQSHAEKFVECFGELLEKAKILL